MTDALTLEVRALIYRDADKLIDWSARLPAGRKFLRSQLTRARQVIRRPRDHDAETGFYAAWLAARITAALDRHKRAGRGSTPSRSAASAKAKAARICDLLGSPAWDPHKLTVSERAENVREALTIAREIVEGRP